MNVLVTGGTGSIGQVLVKRFLADGYEVLVFSRDETKQHAMRQEFASEHLHFQVGDIRDPTSVQDAVRHAHMIIHCAAMKHVTACEDAPCEAVSTNIMGTRNLIRAVIDRCRAKAVVAISTDKACEPSGVMGYTKALMERLIIKANQVRSGSIVTRFVLARLGNVVPSRGSIFPLFQRLARCGEPIMVTSTEMTRFLLPLSHIPDLILDAMFYAAPGVIFVPRIKSARILEIAEAFIADRGNQIVITEPRPGEKIHELLVTESEAPRTWITKGRFVIAPPWGSRSKSGERIAGAYSSKDNRMTASDLANLLKEAM